MVSHPIEDLAIAALYKSYPEPVRAKLLQLRHMIYTLAADDERIGTVEETLKWGVPSYQTKAPKSGTPIRLQWLEAKAQYGIFVHCQTTLIESFKPSSTDLKFDKNRGILFQQNEEFPEGNIQAFLRRALTYHLAS
ncbi:MAG: DUF1801 domain-containing protein [Sneathiella sp.]